MDRETNGILIFLPHVRNRSGIYRYCFGIVRALSRENVNFQTTSFPGNLIEADLRDVDGIKVAHCETLSLFDLRKIIHEDHIGLVHFLTPDLRSLVAIFFTPRSVKKILTIHDIYCSRLRFPFLGWRHWIKEKTRSFLLRLIARFSNVSFMAISEATRRDITKILHLSPERIRTIYPGTTEYFFQNFPRREIIPQKYLLSHFAHLKFFPILALFLGRHPDFQMIFFWSNPSFIPPAERRAKELGIGDKVFFKSNISDAELARLYRDAACFVRYVDDEGFGMPVAEAMASGCPVLVSDRGSLPDVVGIPDVVLPIGATERWMEMLEKIVSDTVFRDALIKKERARAEELHWNVTVKKTLDYYEDLL